jgi:hypothetical protein
MQSIGMVYNASICFITGLTALVVFHQLSRIKKEKGKDFIRFVDYFVLLFGLVWILTGLGVIFVWLGRLELDSFVFKWFTGPLIYLHLIPAFYYFSWSFFGERKKLKLIFNTFFTLVIIFTVSTFWRYGFSASETTYWGRTLIPNEITNNIFTAAIFAPIFIFIIIEIIRKYRTWKRTGVYRERQLLGFNVGFLIYGLAGFFDALASAQGWLMLLARIGSMLPPLIFYLSAVWDEEQ